MPNYETFQHGQDLDEAETRVLFDHWTPGEVPYEPAARRTATMLPPVRPPSIRNVERVTRLVSLARKIRYRGHLAARLDPLDRLPRAALDLDPIACGVTPEDLIELPAGVVGGPVAEDAANAGAAIQSLLSIYCGTTGYDYGHVQAAEERAWLRDAVETGRYSRPLAAATQRQLLERLTVTEAFERFLHRSKPGQKRFSIEGNDVLIPMLDTVIRSAALDGIHDIVVGMAHRGRLNVPAQVLAKPYAKILAEFQTGAHGPTTAPTEHLNHDGWTGDVKYHLGAQKTFTEGETVCVRITPAPNPSHLEFVSPVIQGMVRALQECRERPGMPELDTRTAPAILIHGDASFPGEGIVAETLNLSAPAGYQIGGTVHIIVNNQLGSTTDPADSRSTRYDGDLAKGFEIPIVHVNADDPEACLAAAMPAYAYRERFQKDFLIDLVGYRRWGHNEGDEPVFTQPLLYEQIRQHPTVRALYAQTLVRRRIVPLAEAEEMLQAAIARLQEFVPETAEDTTLQSRGVSTTATIETTVPAEHLRVFNEAQLSRPSGFAPHPKLARMLQARRVALEEGTANWGHAEALAFASLLAEGIAIRLSGQDAERGTFSRRHLVLHDAQTSARFVPLHALPQARASFAIYNSPLSESGVLGFEYGYSGQPPDTLVLWEAQYGDFANAAQVIIDQFISTARAKWRHQPWLVLLLPHGYEGQGPEHSSARVEQLYPFPSTALGRVIDGYPNLREVIRLQKEPKNMGAWSYMAPRLRDLIARVPQIDYIGRPDRAGPAEGSPLLHRAEQRRIVAEAFSGLQGSWPIVPRAK